MLSAATKPHASDNNSAEADAAQDCCTSATLPRHKSRRGDRKIAHAPAARPRGACRLHASARATPRIALMRPAAPHGARSCHCAASPSGKHCVFIRSYRASSAGRCLMSSANAKGAALVLGKPYTACMCMRAQVQCACRHLDVLGSETSASWSAHMPRNPDAEVPNCTSMPPATRVWGNAAL